jgi:DNA-binding NtrC family response regulator
VAAAARVLVVDDDALMLASVSKMLSRQGYEVLPASGPRHALEIVRTPPPVQLILSDIAMPEMRGTQLVSEVFRLSPGTAGLLMTGNISSLPDVPEGVAVIRKPFSTEELILAVRSTLTRSAELRAESRELREQNKQLRSELKGAVQQSIEDVHRSRIIWRDLSDKKR